MTAPLELANLRANLEEARDRLALVLTRMPVGCVMSDPSFRITYWSPAAQRIFGFTPEEVRGKHPFGLITPPEAQPLVASIFQRLAAGEQAIRGRSENTTKDGRTILCDWDYSAVLDRSGSITGTLSLCQEASEPPSGTRPIETRAFTERAQHVARQGSWMIDFEAGDEVTWSTETYRLFGVDPVSFRPSLAGFIELIHADDRAILIEYFELVLQKGPSYSIDHRIMRPSGAVRWVHEEASILRDEDGQPLKVIGTVHDITDRKDAEERLRRSEAEFRAVIDMAPLGFYRTTRDGKLVDANAAFARMLGFDSPEEILGLNMAEEVYFAAEDRERVLADFEPWGRAAEFEIQLKRKDGIPFWTQLNKRAIKDQDERISFFEGFVHDIDHRKKIEASLRANEQRFRGLIEHSADGIALCSAEGKILYASPASTRILGCLPEELVGLRAISLIHPEDLASVAAILREVLSHPGTAVRTQARVAHKNGDWRLLEGIVTNLIDDPAVGGIVNNYRDVTERRNLEQQLLQSQKLESIGRLAGGVAHDFNNLLTVVLSHASFIGSTLKPTDSLMPDVKAIENAAIGAAGLTRQLLAFARQQLIEPRVLDLNETVRHLEDMMRRLLGDDIELTFALSSTLGAVRADPSQMEQVLINLAVNARDAMPRGGKLLIETGDVSLGPEVVAQHPEVTPGDYVMLAVSDTGHGMTDEVREHVFEPFFTTKGFDKGTGLGLATLYGIVKQSGGHVCVYSEQGHGASFKVYLPRVPGQTTAGPEPKRSLPSLGTETILLVEDNESVRRICARSLRSQGYTVLEAANGDDALMLASTYLERIHLLVTDVVMPKMGGTELADRLTELRPTLRVLYTSGYTVNAIVQHGELKKGIEFLAKPFVPLDLIRRVREVLDRRVP